MTQVRKKQYRLLKHQADFVNDTEHRYVGLVGGFGAGKTYAACHKAVKLAYLNKGLHGALMEPIQAMIRGTLMPVLKEVLEDHLGFIEGKHYTYKRSSPESIIFHFPEGDSIIYLCGAENYHRLAGKNLSWFIIDEIDRCTSKEIAIAAFKEAQARIRTIGKCTQGCITTTPEGYHFSHHFFKEQAFFTEGEKQGQPRTDRKVYHAKTTENPYVPNSYVQSIRENCTPEEAEARLNGEWINLRGGNVYYAFNRAANCTDKTLNDFPNHILHVGMDFNANNMSAVISVIDNGLVYVLEEITGGAHVPWMINRLQTQYRHWSQRQGGVIIYPDSSGKSANANASMSSITMLKGAGFQCVYNGNNPSILKERVPSVNVLFKSQQYVNGTYQSFHRGFVNIAKCPVLVKGLEQQGYDPNTGLPDKTSGLDHALDAFGYFCFHKFPVPDFSGKVRVR
jgi:phage terminase large subunit